MKTRISLLLCVLLWGMVGCTFQAGLNGKGDSSGYADALAFVYLSPTERPTELFRYTGSTGASEQLTETGGRVFDYDLNAETGEIIFSAGNDSGGADLWRLPGSGGVAVLLVGCGTETCFYPRYSPQEGLLTYQRGQFLYDSSAVFQNTQIRFHDLTNDADVTLFGSAIDDGIHPVWSPDGNYLAYYQTTAPGIRILDLLGNEVILLRGSNIQDLFAWDGVSRYFYFVVSEITDDTPVTLLQRLDLTTMDIQRFETGLGLEEAITGMKVSPRGDRIIVGVRFSAFLPGQRLVLFDPAGMEIEKTLENPAVSYGNYSWDAAGERVIFQQFALEEPNSKPEIGVWDVGSDAVEVIVTDGYMPKFVGSNNS